MNMQWWTKFLALALTVALGACGGGGGGPSGADAGSAATTPASEAGRNRLFVGAHVKQQHIALFDTLLPAGPTLLLNEVLDLPVGGSTIALAYDSRRDMLYSSLIFEIAVYEKASRILGGTGPTRKIALPPATSSPTAFYLDVEQDVLYVGIGFMDKGQVLVYEGASTLSTGAMPTRAFTLPMRPASMSVDTSRRVVYWVAGSGGDVFAFSLDSSPGEIGLGPRRLSVGNVLVALDVARDRMYVAGGTVLRIFDVVSTAEPREVGVVPLANARAIGYEATNDRLYVGSWDKVVIFDGASRLGGSSSSHAVVVQGPTDALIIGFAFAP